MTALQLLRFVPALLIELLAQSVRWMAERPVRLVIVGLLLLSAWLWIAGNAARDLADDRRVQAVAWHGKFSEQKAEMLKLVGLVRDARIEAARLDRENVQRVQVEWAATLSEVKHGYQADLAAARAALAQRLRPAGAGTGAASAAGGGSSAAVSSIPTLSSGPVRPGDAAIVDGADLDAVTDNTLRLENLIDAWVRAARINVNRQP
jgi:hypothetical protein